MQDPTTCCAEGTGRPPAASAPVTSPALPAAAAGAGATASARGSAPTPAALARPVRTHSASLMPSRVRRACAGLVVATPKTPRSACGRGVHRRTHSRTGVRCFAAACAMTLPTDVDPLNQHLVRCTVPMCNFLCCAQVRRAVLYPCATFCRADGLAAKPAAPTGFCFAWVLTRPIRQSHTVRQ